MYKKAAAIVQNDENDKILVIAVSYKYNESWLPHGHSSLIGIGTVIEIYTVLVLDMHMTNLHCSVCAQKLKSPDPPV